MEMQKFLGAYFSKFAKLLWDWTSADVVGARSSFWTGRKKCRRAVWGESEKCGPAVDVYSTERKSSAFVSLHFSILIV
jgi:hypothetical protein